MKLAGKQTRGTEKETWNKNQVREADWTERERDKQREDIPCVCGWSSNALIYQNGFHKRSELWRDQGIQQKAEDNDFHFDVVCIQ